jgi:acetyl-CoA carboxylase carboxyl transferase subunit beta
MALFQKKNRTTLVVARGAPSAGERMSVPSEELTDSPSIPSGMWEKCVNCAAIVYKEDLLQTDKVCPRCGYHFRLSAAERLEITADEGTLNVFNGELVGGDPLSFPGYAEKLESARSFTGQREAIITADAKVGGYDCVLAAMDSNFMMASMGYAVGEKFTLAAERAMERRVPLVVFTASGGARMQEGMVSLMQMAKASGAVSELGANAVPYIVVLTDPTTGGVTASFAMLGDITLAEPGALVGFAGRSVIEQTTKTSLPSGFQSAEFFLEHGFVDMLVERRAMRKTLGRLLRFHAPRERGQNQ